jgi:gliding motility-associated-like protein
MTNLSKKANEAPTPSTAISSSKVRVNMTVTMVKFGTLLLSYISFAPLCANAQVEVGGTTRTPITIQPESATGLSSIYVLNACTGNAYIKYQSKNTSHPTWYTFGQAGAAYAEAISDNNIEISGNESTLRHITPDCGYVIEDGNARTYFWVVDYSAHELVLNSLTVDDENSCSTIAFRLDGDASPIYYYNINGRRLELSRELSLTYNSMAYSADAQQYVDSNETITLTSVSELIRCTQALCDTEYTLEGDTFLRTWGLPEKSVSTTQIAAQRVEAQTSAEQNSESYDNMQNSSSDSGGSSLGGSAPLDITFTAHVTPAAIFTEWQFASDDSFENISLRDNNTEFTRTFRDAGTTYVRFVAANSAGDCEYTSDTYQVSIGESNLHCPNAFSPQGSPGVNDEWKVSYRSIVEFKCSIFNRWGVCVATLTHPSQGWDGKYNGKYVSSGVYYYVIKARGSDGRKYNLKGDINIINYDETKQSNSTTTTY